MRGYAGKEEKKASKSGKAAKTEKSGTVRRLYTMCGDVSLSLDL